MILPQPYQSRLQKKLKAIRWDSFIKREFHYLESFRRFWDYRKNTSSRDYLRYLIKRLREIRRDHDA